MVTPREEYTSRLAAREASARQLESGLERVGAARLLLAAIMLALAGSYWYAQLLSPLWMLVPAAGFACAVAYHGVLRRRYARAGRAAGFYRRALARLEDRWTGTGRRGERFADPHHIYAADLDLFGEGSLFELLCAARTRMGEQTLAGWLLAPSAIEEIRRRQAGVLDLRDRVDLRERIGTLGGGHEPAVHTERLLAWAQAPAVLGERWIHAVAYLLPALLLASCVGADLTGIWTPVIVVLGLEVAVLHRLKGRLKQVIFPVERAFDYDDLKTFAGLLSQIEREKFRSPPLSSMVDGLSRGGLPASARIGGLATLMMLSEQRKNILLVWLQVPLLYTLHVAFAAERWRRAHGAYVREWMEAAGRFEALSSIAQYGFEHPDDPFPDLLEGRAQLRARGIGHPLIPQSRSIPNEVILTDATPVWLVSGSNMSGKSTLLRTVGLNVVLAMAGAPVRAQSLELTPLQVGASIRINDSLREGSSRFYAEITRLREIKDLSGREPPLLFLIDEMLQGTNSNDRRVGAEGVLRALVDSGSIGLATTHDLALTEIAGLGGGLRNMHFEDHLENGRMRFDYRLREGVVTRSNGLELMRAIGLRV